MTYKIAIPSYKRSITLCNKTLAYLKQTDAELSTITVFVADQQEYDEYRAVVPPEISVIIGQPTLRGQREFIQRYYPEGTKVLSMDDDIEGIYLKLSDKKFEKTFDLNLIAEQGFSACISAGTKLWGIGAVLNALFMKNTTTFDLKYIVGCFWGMIVSHDPQLFVQLEDKEDFERSILYYRKFGSVVRLNNYAPKTNYYKEPGGMQETRTEQRVTDSAHYLLRLFPRFCKLNTTKKSGHTEVRLHHSKKQK